MVLFRNQCFDAFGGAANNCFKEDGALTGLPVMGSVSDSMAFSIPSETSQFTVLEDLGFVFLSFLE